ncbi:MAG: MFS transporter [Nitrososphaeria archaeon]|nr:MFS transporter [Nitrososphaeria archaeon]
MDHNTKTVYLAVTLIGLVSMMGDIVYEGGRGVIPSYLQLLGASAFIVGLVSGLGDFIGYALRLVSGYLSDKSRAYWQFMFIGYGLIIAIPMLSIASFWPIAALFVIMERLGKAVRAPARDTIVSIISKGVGVGKAFGLHELMDQIGAVMGPLIVSTILYFTLNNYTITFATLFIPYTILLVTLSYVYLKVRSKVLENMSYETSSGGKSFSKDFYIYSLAVFTNVLGLIPASLILYKASIILSPSKMDWLVPLLFMLIQLVDAPTALVAGIVFDRIGTIILTIPFFLSIFASFFTFYAHNLMFLIVSCIFYGIVLGMQESVYRAAVSYYVPRDVRGTAYGIFNTVYGVGLLFSGTLFGLLLDFKAELLYIIFYTTIMQILALLCLLKSIRKRGSFE